MMPPKNQLDIFERASPCSHVVTNISIPLIKMGEIFPDKPSAKRYSGFQYSANVYYLMLTSTSE